MIKILRTCLWKIYFMIKVDIQFFYAYFLSRLKNDLLTCIAFPRHQVSLNWFVERTIGNVSWLIFCSLASAIETVQRELLVGSLKAHPVNGIMKRNPFGMGAPVCSQLLWALLAEQRLSCAHCLAGRFCGGNRLTLSPVGPACARLWRYFTCSFRQLQATHWPFESFLNLTVGKHQCWMPIVLNYV